MIAIEEWALRALIELAAKAARSQDDLLPIDAAQRALGGNDHG